MFPPCFRSRPTTGISLCALSFGPSKKHAVAAQPGHPGPSRFGSRPLGADPPPHAEADSALPPFADSITLSARPRKDSPFFQRIPTLPKDSPVSRSLTNLWQMTPV